MNFPFDDLADFDSQLFFKTVNSSALHGFVALYDLNVALYRALRSRSLGLFECMAQHLIQVTFVGSYCDDAYLSTLPQILMVNFGYRYIKFGPQAVLHRANDHSFILQRLCVRNVDIEGQ